MSRETEIARLAEGVRALFGPTARLVDLASLVESKAILEKPKFGVDGCVAIGDRYFLIQIADLWPLPERLVRAKALLGPKTAIIILACASPEATAVRVASEASGAALEHGFGLAVALPEGVTGIFPAGYSLPVRPESSREFGHISKALLDVLDSTEGFSEHFRDCAARFSAEYRQLTQSAPPTLDAEFAVLFKFVTELAQGDRRIFWPVDQLYILKAWERAKVNPKGRDHVFHTFNNLILGAVVLVHFLKNRSNTTPPESFIADNSGAAVLASWEVIWLFTCLFHDPGYVAEKFGATFNFSLGINDVFEPDMAIPQTMIPALQAAFDTELAPARHDLCTLFHQLSGIWTPVESDDSIWQKFNEALKLAYFKVDGRGGLHSLLSGLRLITVCKRPEGVMDPLHSPSLTQKTSVIAALCMLFHDQKCRDIFLRQEIPPISFESLPYAAMLMFVDALQEDRRDINGIDFPAQGFLGTVTVDQSSGNVSVSVHLGAISIPSWPYKIAEMRSVLKWINEHSTTQFSIDYETSAEIQFR